MLPVLAPLKATPPAPGRPEAAFTVDVEDWYPSRVDFDAPITDRVVGNVAKVASRRRFRGSLRRWSAKDTRCNATGTAIGRCTG
jgi:hypothetical protein